MPLEYDIAWGDTVYYGPIADFKLVDANVLLYTLFVPPEVEPAEIDSVALYLATGEIFAQGPLRNVRKKNTSSGTYIYAYINAPEPAELVEVRLTSRSVVPQVNDYCDLPNANVARRFEYIINNGHCGHREDLPEFLPSMVMLSSVAPKTPLFPPDEPFLDPNVGSLVAGTYSFTVTATNGSGESLQSPSHEIQLLQLTAPVAYVQRGSGALASGTHYYQVVALSPGDGRTTGSNEVTLTVTKLATPSAPTLTDVSGGLDAGTYYYAISALSDYGETLASPEDSITITDDQGVELNWSPVSGATGYAVYGRTTSGDLNLIALVDAAFTTYTDWGAAVDESRGPVPEATDSGIRVLWDKVDGAVGYEVYGRITGGSKTLLGAVPSDQFFFDDVGDAAGVLTLPVVNDTQTGVKIKWPPVYGATGYNVYGRTIYSQGLLDSVSGSTFEFVDDGSITPGVAPPSTNTTSAVEWQLVDGSLIYRGSVSSAGSTFVVPTTPPEVKDWDLAMLTVTLGTGRYQTRHVKYNEDLARFEVIDKPFSVTPATGGSSTIAIWAGPGCCGGNCTEEITPAVLFPAAPPEPASAPQYSWLGVHLGGTFLGQPISEATQASDVNYTWNSQINPDRIRTGALDSLFCDENGKTQYDLPLNTRIKTPHGDRLPPGEYSSIMESAPNAVQFTFDSIAVAPGIRCIIYSQPNFTGEVLLDVTGPFYMANFVWRQDPRWNWALDVSVWTGRAAQIIPIEHRYWSTQFSEQDMREWKTGSIQIIRTWL